MKQTTKVTLLSALVFPGVGHLLLKKYAIALAFIASFSYLLIGYIKDVIEKSQVVVDSILKGEIPIEISAISQALEQQGVLGGQQQSLTISLLFFIWGLAAFDAYRIAKKNTKETGL